MGAGPYQWAGGPLSAGAGMALAWLHLKNEKADSTTPLHQAIDVAESILCEALDMAQNVIGHFPEQRDQVLRLAQIQASTASAIYVANAYIAALREVTPEVAGAISEAGTDIGAGLVEAITRLAAAGRIQADE